MPAKEEKKIFETAYITDQAIKPIAEIIDSLIDYRNDDGSNIQSAGGRTLIQRLVGEDSDVEFEWEEFEHTNLVVARWLFQREVMRRFQGALGVAPTDAPKFDARVGFGSRAHKQIERVAEDVVNAYIDNVYLKAEDGGRVRRRPGAGPQGRDGDVLERAARGVQRTERTWRCRSPARSTRPA